MRRTQVYNDLLFICVIKNQKALYCTVVLDCFTVCSSLPSANPSLVSSTLQPRDSRALNMHEIWEWRSLVWRGAHRVKGDAWCLLTYSFASVEKPGLKSHLLWPQKMHVRLWKEKLSCDTETLEFFLLMKWYIYLYSTEGESRRSLTIPHFNSPRGPEPPRVQDDSKIC